MPDLGRVRSNKIAVGHRPLGPAARSRVPRDADAGISASFRLRWKAGLSQDLADTSLSSSLAHIKPGA